MAGRVRRGSTRGGRAARTREREPRSSRRSSRGRRGSPVALFGALAGAALVLMVVVLLATRGGTSNAPVAEPEPANPEPWAPTKTELAEARAAYAEARRLAALADEKFEQGDVDAARDARREANESIDHAIGIFRTMRERVPEDQWYRWERLENTDLGPWYRLKRQVMGSY